MFVSSVGKSETLKERAMEDQHRTLLSSSPMAIHTKVCPCGSVYLYVGHTCLFLRQEEFLDVAQIIRAVESHLLNNAGETLDERSH
jgi:hypothetical protein